jgi:hypothetical protein
MREQASPADLAHVKLWRPAEIESAKSAPARPQKSAK